MLELYRPSQPHSWGSLALKGPDGADFLHRLTTVNIKSLKAGEGTPGFFLNPQGRMRSYFYLWMITKEEFFFEFDAGVSGRWKQELLTVIDQFHFGEKFELLEQPGLACIWLLANDSKTFPETKHTSEPSPGIRLFNHGKSDFGKIWISAWGKAPALETWAQALSAKEIRLDRIEELRISVARPRIDFELSENTNPLEAGLRDAISDNKGCYPGQEVIEKIISLGSPARRLGKLEGTGPAPKAGDAVQLPSLASEVGIITSVIKTERGFQALAYIKKIHAKEGLQVVIPSQPTAQATLVFISSYE
jgi:folate-binding protein YgfZ